MSNNKSNKSGYQTVKDGGWDGNKNFMESYGLKMGDKGDHDEANAIKDAFREHDAKASSGSGSGSGSKASSGQKSGGKK